MPIVRARARQTRWGRMETLRVRVCARDRETGDHEIQIWIGFDFVFGVACERSEWRGFAMAFSVHCVRCIIIATVAAVCFISVGRPAAPLRHTSPWRINEPGQRKYVSEYWMQFNYIYDALIHHFASTQCTKNEQILHRTLAHTCALMPFSLISHKSDTLLSNCNGSHAYISACEL